MAFNYQLLLTFISTHFLEDGVEVSDETLDYIEDQQELLNKFMDKVKSFYSNYARSIIDAMNEYMEDIVLFEVNRDIKSEIEHNFRVTWGEGDVTLISLNFATVAIRSIIPCRLMKICGYRKNSIMYKTYTHKYAKLQEQAIEHIAGIAGVKKYTELSRAVKEEHIYQPFRHLFIKTLQRKKKCIANLYNHIYGDGGRLVFRLFRNSFTIFDFERDIDEITGFRIREDNSGLITIVFNNGMSFSFRLYTNQQLIRNTLSLKFRTRMTNIDEWFAVKQVDLKK